MTYLLVLMMGVMVDTADRPAVAGRSRYTGPGL